MTVDRDVIAEHEHAPPDEVSRATVVAYALAAALLVGWFLFGWLVLRLWPAPPDDPVGVLDDDGAQL